MISILSLGGSIVAPGTVDTHFLTEFRTSIVQYLTNNSEQRLIIVVGGGGVARNWQNAVRVSVPNFRNEDLDWVGIMATRLNAQLVKSLFIEFCPQEIVTNPSEITMFTGRVLVGAGWKPGFSTDYVAVLLAEKFCLTRIINLSNTAKVYDSDPRNNSDAKPFDTLDWSTFKSLLQNTWSPGLSLPFDPVAATRASELHIELICADGRDIANSLAILSGKKGKGTTIGPS